RCRPNRWPGAGVEQMLSAFPVDRDWNREGVFFVPQHRARSWTVLLIGPSAEFLVVLLFPQHLGGIRKCGAPFAVGAEKTSVLSGPCVQLAEHIEGVVCELRPGPRFDDVE